MSKGIYGVDIDYFQGNHIVLAESLNSISDIWQWYKGKIEGRLKYLPGIVLAGNLRFVDWNIFYLDSDIALSDISDIWWGQAGTEHPNGSSPGSQKTRPVVTQIIIKKKLKAL